MTDQTGERLAREIESAKLDELSRVLSIANKNREDWCFCEQGKPCSVCMAYRLTLKDLEVPRGAGDRIYTLEARVGRFYYERRMLRKTLGEVRDKLLQAHTSLLGGGDV